MKTSIIFLLFVIFEAFPQREGKIFAYDADILDKYGYEISLDKNYIAIASQDSVFINLVVGAVYIYKLTGDNFELVTKVRPDTFNSLRNFYGSTISFSENLLFIGSNRRVHIYEILNTTISKIKTLKSPDNSEDFGFYFGSYKKDLLVGAPLDGPLNIGSAYFFSYQDSNWFFDQKIFPSYAERHAQFGTRIAFQGNYALISAPGDGYVSGPMRGSVFFFEKTDSGWIERQKILPSDSIYYQLFGIDIAIDKNRIAIGAVGSIYNQFYQGRIYVYEIINNSAKLQDSIFASDGYPGNNFGYSFKLLGDSLFVGASGNQYMKSRKNTSEINQPQAAYLFVKTNNTWEEKKIFKPHDPTPHNVFGYCVDFLNGNFIVGSPGDSTWGMQSGAAYIFQPSGVSVSRDNYLINTYSLSQNYPNPFNPSTTISWQSPVGSWQTLKVYDVLGKEVATLVNEYKPAGSYEVEFQSTVGNRQLANGVYYYQLRSGEIVQTRKMIFSK